MAHIVKRKTHILFVCTGNTCRSPMAQAVAQRLIDALEPTAHTVTVDSAGVAAGNGQGASLEAIEALSDRGIDLRSHRSKQLTPELIDQAQLILTMTPAHAHAVIAMVPESADKVFPLDAIHPIADPIGQSVEVYRDVADELERLIQARFKEMLT